MNRAVLMAGVMCAARLVFSAHVVDLAGTWTLRQVDDPTQDAIRMAIPGGVHTALREAGRIPDPFFGRNERAVQWVGQKDWLVERTFEVDDALLARKSVILRLERVDLFCEISINGTKVGETKNFFRRYDFDVKSLLKKGKNTFSALFRSSEKRTEEMGAQLPYPIPMVKNGLLPHINLIRKPICHAGWDWGLSLMVTGFVTSPRLIGSDVARIDYLYCDQVHNDGSVNVTVSAEVASPEGGETRLDLSVRETGQKVSLPVKLVPGKNSVAIPVTIAHARLWWPNGAGEQPRYTLTLSVGDDTFTRRLGLRTLEVVNKPDEYGVSMSFRINGKDIFCKGANWIPCDAFINRQTPGRYLDLLSSAKDANMNIVRLWGGGQFEDDVFYDTCEDLGLLIWHDCMFSCALYPSTKDFLGEVREELRHQIRRLRDCASIALWCGDNECIGALTWFDESRRNRDRYLINYDRLSQMMTAEIARLDPSRTFWPSSPCAGPGDFSDGWHDDRKGDMHYWNVWHSNKEFSDYYNVKPRFCSEFGFQSFPSRKVALTFCNEKDLNPTSPDFEYHQKNDGGNTRILATMARYFRFPESVDGMLYLSQVQQAMAIKTAVEAWRHIQPRCMGTIFWQLNDNWPVSSWSSVEYGGKWKHLQYQAKRFYAPLAVCAVPVDGNPNMLEIWAINDHDEALSCAATADVWTFNGVKPVESIALPAVVSARSAKLLRCVSIERFGTESERANRFLSLEIRAMVNGKQEVDHNHWMFSFYKSCDLNRAEVDAIATEWRGQWNVTLTTDKPAFFVWLDTDVRGEFSDNSFLLLPGRPARLTFKQKGPGTFDQFKRSLSVTHLRKTYR